MQIKRCTAGLLAGLLFAAPGFAGPPLAIDDPGILDPWQWEIIVATTGTSTDGGDAYQAPLLDVSLGLAENVQISAAYPYVYSDPDGGDSEWDFGNFQAGIKWRFIDLDQLQVAFSLVFAFGVTRSNADKGIGADEDVLYMPIDVEYVLNDRWSVLGELGYASVNDAGDEWGYGAALVFGLADNFDLLFELEGSFDTDIENDFLNGRAGFDYAFSEATHGLFSIATGLWEPGGEDRLDWDIFLGIQFFR